MNLTHLVMMKFWTGATGTSDAPVPMGRVAWTAPARQHYHAPARATLEAPKRPILEAEANN